MNWEDSDEAAHHGGKLLSYNQIKKGSHTRVLYSMGAVGIVLNGSVTEGALRTCFTCVL